jgi:hypothetical protein
VRIDFGKPHPSRMLKMLPDVPSALATFPGAVGRYDLEAVVAYGAFAAPLMRQPASNREHSTTSAAVT